MVHVKQANGVIGDDSSQSAFALYQRQVAQVLAVKVQKVKGTEERRTTPEKQFIEPRISLFIQAGNLAVKNGMACLQFFVIRVSC